tara:strand:- start:1138 stop:1320 length:183 start_codon:yes stop_codon:yes gene_type:complete
LSEEGDSSLKNLKTKYKYKPIKDILSKNMTAIYTMTAIAAIETISIISLQIKPEEAPQVD